MEAFEALHPTDQILQSYGLGELDDMLSQKVTRHLEDCPPCQHRVAEISSDSFPGRKPDAKDAAGRSAAGSPPSVGAARKSDSGFASPSSPSAGLPPELVDHPDYEIIRELGRGGMGVVYLVHNRLMGRNEAIKVISRQLMERPVVLDRFLREIRSVARLRHPNVVAAYSATRMGESIVYAMEYVEGLDLAVLVKRKGPLPVAHASYFIHQVALGLQHAHDHGIVHRDIKPGNLILTRSGDRSTVKILDFGLNKATTEDAADHSLTREGQMLGTPDYIAPEQTLDAQSVDIRADIYSLGCSLYYLLSGRPPFRGGSLYEVLQAHHSAEAPALDLLRPEIPIELAAVVAKMMAKQAVQRFQTPAEVASALAPFFKKGNSAALESKPEHANAHQAGPSSGSDRSSLTKTSAGLTPAPAASVPTQADPSRPNSGWGSLVELAQTGRLIDDASATRESRPVSHALWLSIAATVAASGLIAAWVGGAFLARAPVAPSAERTLLVDRVKQNEIAPATVPHALEPAKQTAPQKPETAPASPLIAVRTKGPGPSPPIDRPRDRIATTDVNRDQPTARLDRSLEPGRANSGVHASPGRFSTACRGRQPPAIAGPKRLPADRGVLAFARAR